MVYEKTASGINEIAGTDCQLTPKQRQVLILIDGKRPLDDIVNSLPRLAVADIIQELGSQGFIQNPKASKAFNPRIVISQNDTPLIISEEKMVETKESTDIKHYRAFGINGAHHELANPKCDLL